MNKTSIDWVKNPDGTQGYTWNPITGCLNGCPYCYARKLANGRLSTRYLANTKTAPSLAYCIDGYDKREPFYPRFWSERLEQPYVINGKKGIFTCDMSDLFGKGIPPMWTRNVMLTMELSPQHRFYLLTKQPQNLIKFSPFPDNCWVGVTATDQEKLYWAVQELVQIEARVKFLSLEPLLHWKSPTGWLIKSLDYYLKWGGIGQVIIGAQTKPYKQPETIWVEEIIRACDKAGIPVFIKHNMNSENLPQNAFNKEGLVRREMPEGR